MQDTRTAVAEARGHNQPIATIAVSIMIALGHKRTITMASTDDRFMIRKRTS